MKGKNTYVTGFPYEIICYNLVEIFGFNFIVFIVSFFFLLFSLNFYCNYFLLLSLSLTQTHRHKHTHTHTHSFSLTHSLYPSPITSLLFTDSCLVIVSPPPHQSERCKIYLKIMISKLTSGVLHHMTFQLNKCHEDKIS